MGEDMSDAKSREQKASERRLTSENLAVLVVDALIDAKIVAKEHLERAIQIATEEINVRKAAGDY